MGMEIYEVADHKRQYMSLLLLTDEQESMIDTVLHLKTGMKARSEEGVKGFVTGAACGG